MGKPIMKVEFQDLVPQSPIGVLLSGCGSVICFILIILFLPASFVQLGQFRVGLIRNKVTGVVDMGNPYLPGRYWIGFWNEFVVFRTTLQTIEFATESPETGVKHLSLLRSRDQDGKQILLDISVQYRLHPDQIGQIYKEMLLHYEDIYISKLRDRFAKACNQFQIHEVWENYTSVVSRFKQSCVEVLAEGHAECWGVQLWGVTLTSGFESKLIETQVRKQAQKTETSRKVQTEVRAKTKVLLAEYEKNVTIILAGGEATQMLILRNATSVANANTVSALGKAVEIIDENIRLKNSTNTNGTSLTAEQKILYQRLLMLKRLENANFIYGMDNQPDPEAINVLATRDIMDNRPRSRRLLYQGLQESQSHEL